MEEIVRLHAIVRGRVQGVGFRYFVLETAQELGLNGWVRNLWDGSVELTAEGEKPILLYLEKALAKGPRMANVTSVISDWEPANGEFIGFRARSSA
jgi:acylphosphatase